MLEDGNVGTVLTDADHATLVREAVLGLPGAPRVLTWGEEGAPERQRLEDLPPGPTALDPDGLVSVPLQFSSGTTGRPKRVMLPPILFPGAVTRRAFRAWARTARFVGLGPHLVCGPMYHAGPLQATWLLAAGVPIVAPRRFDAIAVLETIERERIATTLMVPTHFIRLLKARDESERDLRRQLDRACDPDRRRLPGAGQARDDRLVGPGLHGDLRRLRSRWRLLHRERRVAQPTEARSAGPCRSTAFSSSTTTATSFRSAPKGKIYFEDSTGRGIRYEDAPELTARAHLRPGVFTLGEVGRVDEEGYLYLTDRDSDKVVSGGVNLYPAEIETVLAQHPAVVETAVIGVEHPEMGEELRALVVLREGAVVTESELIAFVRGDPVVAQGAAFGGVRRRADSLDDGQDEPPRAPTALRRERAGRCRRGGQLMGPLAELHRDRPDPGALGPLRDPAPRRDGRPRHQDRGSLHR